MLKCVLGLLEPDAGTIEIDGRDILRMHRTERGRVRSHMGMLFQNGALFDSLPVWENVTFGLLAQHKITRREGRQRAAEILGQLGLAPSVGELYPSELSGGMQKRVALARAIAAQPDIMFFDEPTTGLDPIMGAVIDEGMQGRVEISVLGASDMGARGSMPRRPVAARQRPATPRPEEPAPAHGPALAPAAAEPAAAKPTQDEFGFGEVESRGQFERTDRNLFDGQDLDVPTYLRRGIKIAI